MNLEEAKQEALKTMGPLEKLAAWKMMRWFKREGKPMLGRMLGNKWTTVFAALIALYEALCATGALPQAACDAHDSIVGILAALGLLVAKDATTGSAPPPTRLAGFRSFLLPMLLFCGAGLTLTACSGSGDNSPGICGGVSITGTVTINGDVFAICGDGTTVSCDAETCGSASPVDNSQPVDNSDNSTTTSTTNNPPQA